MLAFIGAWTLLEIVILTLVILPLAWATGADRNGRDNYKWWVVLVGLVVFVCYSTFSNEPGSSKSMLSAAFWTSRETWLGLGKYLAIGVVYAVVEMLVGIFEEKRQIKSFWNRFVAADIHVNGYVNGIAVSSKEATSQITQFCRDWNEPYRIVKLQTHELERVPQTSINTSMLQDNFMPWLLLWPGYLVSLLLGRILDRIINFVLKVLRRFGNAVLSLVFRNTFKTKS